jgi:hypothetical protein
MLYTTSVSVQAVIHAFYYEKLHTCVYIYIQNEPILYLVADVVHHVGLGAVGVGAAVGRRP